MGFREEDFTSTVWDLDTEEAAAQAAELEPLSVEEIFLRQHRLALNSLGVGEAWPSAHDEIVAATSDVLHSASTEDRYTPRRPSMLPQLLRAVNDEDVSRRELVSIISRDPSLVGNLLKMANSPFYRVNSQAVESIDRAVVILGNDGIRSLIAAAQTQPVFQIRGGDFPKFPGIAWEHTFRTASATVTHAAIVEKSDPFAAQLLGLVHGMAAIVVFRVVFDQYEARPRFKANAAVIASLLDSQTAGVARRIAGSWGLSDRILEALDDQTPGTAAEKLTPMGRSLEFGRVASALAVLAHEPRAGRCNRSDLTPRGRDACHGAHPALVAPHGAPGDGGRAREARTRGRPLIQLTHALRAMASRSSTGTRRYPRFPRSTLRWVSPSHDRHGSPHATGWDYRSGRPSAWPP